MKALSLMLLLVLPAYGRSHAARAAFMRKHPCPATGLTRGVCPGYVVDHVKPLECGGADSPRNMQWQTTARAKEKDKTETQCAGPWRRDKPEVHPPSASE